METQCGVTFYGEDMQGRHAPLDKLPRPSQRMEVRNYTHFVSSSVRLILHLIVSQQFAVYLSCCLGDIARPLMGNIYLFIYFSFFEAFAL